MQLLWDAEKITHNTCTKNSDVVYTVQTRQQIAYSGNK